MLALRETKEMLNEGPEDWNGIDVASFTAIRYSIAGNKDYDDYDEDDYEDDEDWEDDWDDEDDEDCEDEYDDE
jgi:hypothetical protein